MSPSQVSPAGGAVWSFIVTVTCQSVHTHGHFIRHTCSTPWQQLCACVPNKVALCVYLLVQIRVQRALKFCEIQNPQSQERSRVSDTVWFYRRERAQRENIVVNLWSQHRGPTEMKEEPLTTTDLSLTLKHPHPNHSGVYILRQRKLTLSEVSKHITEVIERQCMMGRWVTQTRSSLTVICCEIIVFPVRQHTFTLTLKVKLGRCQTDTTHFF